MSLTFLYDAECDFCRHSAHVLRTIDTRRRLRFRPLQEFVSTGPGDPSPEALHSRIHVRDEAGSWSAGGAAMRRVADEIPLLAPLALAGRFPGAGALVEVAYRLVAEHRGTVSHALRLESCRFEPDLEGP